MPSSTSTFPYEEDCNTRTSWYSDLSLNRISSTLIECASPRSKDIIKQLLSLTNIQGERGLENHPEQTVEWDLASGSGSHALAFKQQEGRTALSGPLALLSFPSIVFWHSKPLPASPSIYDPFLFQLQSPTTEVLPTTSGGETGDCVRIGIRGLVV
nr:hypothetical protein Iba_scaffold66297CG0010 [Ipomoea batatas]GMD56685.1 hypothetical protein Iba_chr11eCG5530 [Ipomoea batatas]